MCYHNFILHSGCGHIAESHTPWTLCAAAQSRLLSSRNIPLTPPLSPPPVTLPKRSSTISIKPKSRFFSFTRTSTSASISSTSSSRRTVSNPAPTQEPRSSSDSFTTTEVENARCKGTDVVRRELTSPEKFVGLKGKEVMRVCKECERWIEEMRFMVGRWEKTGSVRGTRAFEEFLKERYVGERDLYREWGIEA